MIPTTSPYSLEEMQLSNLANPHEGDGVSVKDVSRRIKNVEAKLITAATFIAEVQEGRRPVYHLTEAFQGQRRLLYRSGILQEAMTPSDFSALFGDILDRQLLAQYENIPTSWPSYVRRGRVNDFRSVRRLQLDGLRTPLDIVPATTAYHQSAVTSAATTYNVVKRGKTVQLPWETLVNDDLDAFGRIPGLLAESAVHSEEKFAAGLFCNSAGPLSTVFTGGNNNIVPSNPALSQAALEAAASRLLTQKDADNNPIVVSGMILLVPPQLEVLATKLVTDIQSLQFGPGGSTTDANVIAAAIAGWQRRIKVVTNYWLPLVNTTNGATAWYLVADPGRARPFAEMGFLRAHEAPEIFLKDSDARRLGGGTVEPLEGSFDNDTVDYRIRHIYGGVNLEPRSAVSSEGDGT